ncbi:hypothetical protein LTR37_000515 [Vermiconidia calcicola]|uniref:Uncharacterized protein n=1 Tax=Vermiconidia calcicola TaxID=1690605 RepID=A0ACC3P040_9PEZI|nr:hypothetical protein LTR37_000515 [Vermiconidia calcicola]
MASNTPNTMTDDACERAKETVVPDLMSPDEIRRRRYIDKTQYRRPESLTQVFNYAPAFKPFSELEQLGFAEAFKDHPKDFAAIAAILPGRSMKECIQFYYAKKSDGRFKTESRRQRLAVKGLTISDIVEEEADDNMPLSLLREKQAAAEADPELDVTLIDREIKKLRALTGQRVKDKTFRRGYPKSAMKVVVLPRPDLTVLCQAFTAPFHLTDDQALIWLRSATVLPLVKQWKTHCLDVSEYYVQMQCLLFDSEFPWSTRAHQIADHAERYGEQEFELKMQNSKAFMITTNFAAKIAKSNSTLLERSELYRFQKVDDMRAAVFVLFTAYADIRSSPNSFFSVLLDTELAAPVALSVRKSWEKKYLFEGENSEATQ